MKTKPYTLEIHPAAMERCFWVADILERIDEPYTEYGLVGLASEHNPFYIIATPLLHGQQVSSGGIYQPGLQVLRLRQEMQTLSERVKSPLVCSAFVHRHPASCMMSSTDEDFLSTTFIKQAFSAYSVHCSKIREADEFVCKCGKAEPFYQDDYGQLRQRVEYCVCFSIIVNKERDLSVTAAVQALCACCGEETTSLAPAALKIRPDRQVTCREREKLTRLLEAEVQSKLQFTEDKVSMPKE